MQFTAEQLTKAKAAATAEELITFAREEGVEVAEEDIRAWFEALHKEDESAGEALADEELDNVAGGCGDSHARHMRWNKEDCYQEHPGNCPVCRGPMQHVRTLRAAQIYHCPKGNVDFRAECCGYHHYYMTRI